MKSIVVAYDKSRAIGANGDMPWGRDLPSDLQHFKQLTMGNSIIVGRKTFEKDFRGRGLPGRQTIVVSRSEIEVDNAIAVKDLEAAYEVAEQEVFVVGGGTIYKLALKDVDIVYATEVAANYPNADTHFPRLDKNWRETHREQYVADDNNKYDYDFVTYKRV